MDGFIFWAYNLEYSAHSSGVDGCFAESMDCTQPFRSKAVPCTAVI